MYYLAPSFYIYTSMETYDLEKEELSSSIKQVILLNLVTFMKCNISMKHGNKRQHYQDIFYQLC